MLWNVIRLMLAIFVFLMIAACGNDGGTTTPLPTISGTPVVTASVGTAYNFTPTATNATSFSISGTIPPGLSFNLSTGTLRGTPTTIGIYNNIAITATNVTGSASLATFTITVPITFESQKHADTVEPFIGYIYSEGGYQLSGGLAGFSSVGTLDPRFTGSTSLFGRYIPTGISLSREDGVRFTIRSIDYAYINNPPDGPLTISFCGQKDQLGVCSVTQTFTLAQITGPQTFSFSIGFNNLSYLLWYQGTPQHQFDNIVVE